MEKNGIDARGQSVGSDAEGNLSGGLQWTGVYSSAKVIDNHYSVVASVAEVNIYVCLAGGRVGVELAKGFFRVDGIDANGRCGAGVEWGTVGVEYKGDVVGGHGQGVKVV